MEVVVSSRADNINIFFFINAYVRLDKPCLRTKLIKISLSGRGLGIINWIGELYAYGFVQYDIPVDVAQQPGVLVTLKHLNDIAVTAGNEQKLSIRSDVKVTWVDACLLIPDFG